MIDINLINDAGVAMSNDGHVRRLLLTRVGEPIYGAEKILALHRIMNVDYFFRFVWPSRHCARTGRLANHFDFQVRSKKGKCGKENDNECTAHTSPRLICPRV